jgi:hypothetical protein
VTTFLDAFSKESEVYLIKYKSEMPAMYRRYKALKERPEEGRVIGRLHANGGGEYMGDNFRYDLKEEGTTFTYSVPASQQQNGFAERLNQTLLNKSKKTMNLSGLSDYLQSTGRCHVSTLTIAETSALQYLK